MDQKRKNASLKKGRRNYYVAGEEGDAVSCSSAEAFSLWARLRAKIACRRSRSSPVRVKASSCYVSRIFPAMSPIEPTGLT